MRYQKQLCTLVFLGSVAMNASATPEDSDTSAAIAASATPIPSATGPAVQPANSDFGTSTGMTFEVAAIATSTPAALTLDTPAAPSPAADADAPEPDALDSAATTPPAPASEPNKLLHFLGKLHPVSVHFPIALIILAAFVDILALIRCRLIFGETARTLLAFGVAASIVTIPLGWANAATSEHTGQEATVELHRWLGIAAAATSLAAFALGNVARSKSNRTVRASYMIVLLASAVGIAVVGHLGGALVYGDDYLQF